MRTMFGIVICRKATVISHSHTLSIGRNEIYKKLGIRFLVAAEMANAKPYCLSQVVVDKSKNTHSPVSDVGINL